MAGFASAVIVGAFGFALMSGPANATDNSSGSINTATTTVESLNKSRTTGNECQGDACERRNWCPPAGENPTPKVLGSDAPVVDFYRVRDKGDVNECVQKPRIKFACCVPDKGYTADVVVEVTNPNRKGGYKIRIVLDEGGPQERWVKAGETEKFVFHGVGNGKHKIHSAVWTGKGNNWCAFEPVKITVKCAAKPSTSPSTVPSTVPTTAPTTSTPPTTVPSTSTAPTSSSPSVTPSASASTTPVPGGGGGDNEPSLPVTGSSGVLIGTGIVLVAGGLIALLILRRRRQVRFTA